MSLTRPFILIGALAAAAVLSACAGGAGTTTPLPLNPTSRWSLQVEEGHDRIALAVHQTGLSANQRAALSALAGRFAQAGGDVLVVQAPAGNDPVAGEAAWSARAALQDMGVPPHRIRVESYYAPDPRAPILAGFTTVQARVPRCGTAWEGLSQTASNQSQSNFGCAVNANLAAQIADPRDIVQPQAMTPGDAARRTVVFDNYRAGQPTSAPQEDLVRSRVSQAVD
ncbi:MAG: CpaD family pilus assembly protein [Brevundimonas sp.]|uniref:CpaD family pilus assembly protein n=1 Tax=Brevundimonas sp. TaxID=1871086 RepID=UPI00391BDFF4